MAATPKIKIAELEISVKDLLEAQAKLRESIRQTKEETAALEAQQKALRDEGKTSSDAYKENAKQIELNKTATAGLSQEYRSNQTILASMTTANNDHAGTLEKLNARNKELRTMLQGLNLDTEEGRKAQKLYVDEINRNTDFIKKNSDAYVQQKMNIGNYKSALDALPGPLQQGAKGIQGMATAAKAFLANPLAIVITLIVGAVAGLVKIFKTFDPIIDKIEQGMAALNAVFKVVQSSVINLITGHRGHGESMREAARAAVELKKAEQDLDDMNMLLLVSDKKAKRQIDELLLQSKDRTKSEEDRQALIDKAMQIEEDQYKQRKAIADQEVTIAQNKIIVGRKLSEEEIRNLREQGVAYAIKLKETKAVTDDEVKALAEALANQETILNDSVSIREKAINRRNALEDQATENALKAQEKEAELNEKRKEQLDELNDATRVYYETQLAAAEAEMLAEIELEKQKAAEKERIRTEEGEKQKQWEEDLSAFRLEKALIDAENERITRETMLNDRYQAELVALKREEEAEIQAALKTGASVSLITKKYAAIEKVIEREKQMAKLDITAGFAGAISGLLKKESAAAKAAAIVQTVINTYKGAMSAFAETPGGIIIKSLAAATAVATGAAAVRNILKTEGGAEGAAAGVAALPGAGQSASENSMLATTSPTNTIVVTPPVLVLEEFQAVQDTSIKVKNAGQL